MPRPRLEPQQFVPQTDPALLLALIEYAAANGIAGERLCANLGFGVAELRGGHLVSRRQAWWIIRRALRLSVRSDLGLEVGRSQGLHCFGLPGYAMAAAPDLAEAIEIGVRYQRQGGGLLDVDWRVEDGTVSLVARSSFNDPLVLRFLVEELFASLIALGRILLGEAPLPLRIDLVYPEPAHAQRYRELFGVMPRFGQDGNRFVLDAAWLRRPLRKVAPIPVELLQLLEQRDQSQPHDAVQALEQLLARPGLAALSAERAARLLDLSVRTLHRRLREQGTSFRAVSVRVRSQMARQLLGESAMTVAAVGQALGFSDARAFRHAFKQWCGTSPGALRNVAR
jgi:AraC-like DNA-binding protein